MPLSRDNDYSMYLYTCNRCRGCTVLPSPSMKPFCPAYSMFGFFAYSGGGKGYVAQGILEGKVEPSAEVAQVAANCLLCGACAQACPPGFDTMAFIRDLRDHMGQKGIYANAAQERLIENTHKYDNPWGKSRAVPRAPLFSGEKEILVWLGCRERMRAELLPGLKKILEAAGVSWGVLADEYCCGAPLIDLGDRKGFMKKAADVIEAVNASGAERVLVLCPHCAATMMVDYMEAGDLEVDPVTLPSFLAELIADERISLGEAEETVTFHDPCRLAKRLEEQDPAREILEAAPGLELREMERRGEWGWCCGSGAWAPLVAPKLSRYAARERIKEAGETGADKIVTACSYCTELLGRQAKGTGKVEHIVSLVAGRVRPGRPEEEDGESGGE